MTATCYPGPREARLKMGLSLEELSTRTGVAASELADYEEQPGDIPVGHAKRIVEALKCSIDDISFE